MEQFSLPRKVLTIAFLLLGLGSSAFAKKPTAEEQQLSLQSITNLIASKYYIINTSQATGMTGATAPVPGAVKISGDNIYSTLPYWGAGYNTFGSDSFLSFKGTITDYRTEPGKKNKLYLYINTKEPKGKKIAFKVEIFYNGIIFMSVTGTSLQPMRYAGVIETIDTEEKDDFQQQQSPDLFPLR